VEQYRAKVLQFNGVEMTDAAIKNLRSDLDIVRYSLRPGKRAPDKICKT